jgi:hypothetical protein
MRHHLERDLRVGLPTAPAARHAGRQLMTANVVTCSPDDSLKL